MTYNGGQNQIPSGKERDDAERAGETPGITRSSVNAWELDISVPSTQYIVELAALFNVSTDYLLGVDRTASLDLSGLTEEDIRLVYQIVDHLRAR